MVQTVKCLPTMRETQVQSLGWEDLSWRRKWQPTPVLLPGKSHGWRSLVGYSPWGRKESDMTEQLHFHFSLSLSGCCLQHRLKGKIGRKRRETGDPFSCIRERRRNLLHSLSKRTCFHIMQKKVSVEMKGQIIRWYSSEEVLC